MSNTDVKLLANAFVIPLASHTSSLIGPEQACVRDRDILAHVVRAEAWGIAHNMRGEKYSSLLLTDFASAFPSLSTSWLFHALRSMNIPLTRLSSSR
eukprot:1515396-Pyramimonas_sp.AAC.1